MSDLPDAVQAAINAPARLEATRRYLATVQDNDPDLQRISRLAAQIAGSPVALVTFLDQKEQTFGGRSGVDLTGTPVKISFCSHAIASDETPFIVPDATRDERFRSNPLVTGDTHMRFYAGFSLELEGQRVGTLCTIDTQPREGLTPAQAAGLADLAELTVSTLEFKLKEAKLLTSALDLDIERNLHRAATDAAQVATWIWDIKTDIVRCNRWLPRLFHMPETDLRVLPAADVFAGIHPDDLAMVRDHVADTFENGAEFNVEFRVGNGRHWVVGRGQVLARDKDGNALSMIGTNLDITDSKNEAERTKVLLREINHRVKNTLAMLQSLARQTLRAHPQPEKFMEAFSARLSSIANAHTLLSDSEWKPVSLIALIEQQVMPMVYGQQFGLQLDGEDVELPPDQALALGLMLHELATNASKYGALAVPEGHISISWEVFRDGEYAVLQMNWQEHGGPKVTPLQEPGFGTILIKRSLDKIIDSAVELDFHPDGVRAGISMPIHDMM